MTTPYIGEIRMFAGNFAPVNWAICDGSLLNISENEALFSLIGTTYGGNGRTTFALPDLRGRVPIHQGSGIALTTRTLGSKGGTEEETLVAANLPSHTHVWQASSDTADSGDPSGKVLASNVANDLYNEGTSNAVAMASTAIPSSGGHDSPSATANLMAYQAIYFIIALVGLYPSQN